MEKEISSGAMLGIVLIALAAIIGLGFGIFAIAKNTANDGIASVQDGLNSASQSVYTDYDQRIVTGTQVNSALNSFSGKNTAILIATNSFKDQIGKETGLAAVDSGNGVKAAYKGFGADIGVNTGERSIPLVQAYKNKESYDTAFPNSVSETGPAKTGDYDMQMSNHVKVAKEGVAAFINYNALLTGSDGMSTDSVGTITDEGERQKITENANGFAGIYFDTNCFKTDVGLATADGRVQFNNVTANINKVGMMEHISSTARYQSYLLKDGSGTTIGIVFEQQVS